MNINYDKVAEVAFHIREGLPEKKAVVLAGIAPSEWQEWRKDQRVKKIIEEAEALLMRDLLKPVMEKAKNGDWRAAHEVLKHRFKEDWSKADGAQVNIAISVKELDSLMTKQVEVLGKPQRELPSAEEIIIEEMKEES